MPPEDDPAWDVDPIEEAYKRGLKQGVASERERCARLAQNWLYHNSHAELAAAIRRGD